MGMIWVGYRRAADEARAMLEDPDGVDALLESDDDETSVDLDKAWHGLHWVLTGGADPTDHPLSDAIFGGEPVGDDLGYGPARLLAPDRVVEVSRALAGIDTDQARARVDPAAMSTAEIYPNIWDEADVFDTYVLPALESLRTFYAAAANANEAVIQTIC